MTKVLLVEDDNNLREIFEMRLQADGYQTVIAGDGEEGLTVAMQEKPDLIIADVMMPKLSGFDMLESLRATPGMKDIKVIMMTALGQAEDQERGEKLGVVKYLVKSQATLEDFARVIKEVMPPDGAGNATPGDNKADGVHNISNQKESENKMPDDQTPTMPTNDTPAEGTTPASDPSAPATNPVSGDMSAPSTPADSGQMTTAQEQSQVQGQMASFGSTTPASDSPAPSVDAPVSTPEPSSSFAPTTPPAASTTTPYDSPASTTDSSTGASTPADPAMPGSTTPPAPADPNDQTV